jgi:Tfp pilus assembly protein PilO
MANLRQAQHIAIGILIALLVVDVAAALVLLTPLAGSGATRQREFDSVRQQVHAKMKVVIPPDQVQDRVEFARKQIGAFYKDRLATGSSALTAELGKLAGGSGVRLNSARYEELDSDLPGVRHVRISADISGDYVQEVKFINAVERARMFFIINNVALAEQQGGAVRLTVTLETYLKSEAE